MYVRETEHERLNRVTATTSSWNTVDSQDTLKSSHVCVQTDEGPLVGGSLELGATAMVRVALHMPIPCFPRRSADHCCA
jgi:hypothetical protein